MEKFGTHFYRLLRYLHLVLDQNFSNFPQNDDTIEMASQQIILLTHGVGFHPSNTNNRTELRCLRKKLGYVATVNFNFVFPNV